MRGSGVQVSDGSPIIIPTRGGRVLELRDAISEVLSL